MTSPLFAQRPDTYWGQFDQISQYNGHLHVFERMWAAWYSYMQNDVLATGIMSFVMHEVVYFGRSLPWIIIDRLRFFNKYKIQNQKVPTSQEQWKCAKLVLLSHFTVELPQIWYVTVHGQQGTKLMNAGSSTLWRNTVGSPRPSPFLRFLRYSTKSLSSSCLKIPGTTFPTVSCTLPTSTKTFTRSTTSILHRSAWRPNTPLLSKS